MATDWLNNIQYNIGPILSTKILSMKKCTLIIFDPLEADLLQEMTTTLNTRIGARDLSYPES